MELAEMLLIPDAQIIVIKRYDDDGGIYPFAAAVPDLDEDYEDGDLGFDGEELDGLEYLHGDFIKQPADFCNQLFDQGFYMHFLGHVDPRVQHGVMHNVLPIEWHGNLRGGVLDAVVSERVLVFNKTP